MEGMEGDGGDKAPDSGGHEGDDGGANTITPLFSFQRWAFTAALYPAPESSYLATQIP